MAMIDFRRVHLAIIGLTIVYLLFELPFSAQLLDAVGGNASIHEIEGMETKGRLLAGFAFALFGLSYVSIPLIRRRGWGAQKGVFFALTLFVGMMATMYFAQRAFVDRLVDDTTPSERKQAVSTVFFTQEIKAGRVEAFGVTNLDDPASKAFLAILPLVASGLADPAEQLSLEEVINQRLLAEMGTFEHVWNRYAATYNEALGHFAELKDGRRLAEEEARRQYVDYRYQLQTKGKGVLPDSKMCSTIKQKMNLPATMPWDCVNEQFFVRYVAGLIIKKELKGRGMENLAGVETEADLLAALDIPVESQESLRVKYEAKFATERDALKDLFSSDDADFGPGGHRWQQGEDAIKSLIVPPVALFFSIIGAIGHLVKLVVISTRGSIRWVILLVMVVGGGYIGIDEAALTQTSDYKVATDGMSLPTRAVIRGIVQFESWMYPLCSTIDEVF